jgi:putative protease
MTHTSPGLGPVPELLAPAGSPEAFRAAVAAGADAIYLSGRKFGARKFAPNFSDEEIAEAVRYAHCWGVRVYVTVNTLIHDRELNGVAEYLIWLYSAGVDAVLVQDVGVAALARELVPDLALHASTQMTIYNADGVRWAAGQGFSRVVLARELSLAEVQEIVEKTADTGVGLEVFAHGALCYSYSGQCLLSSVIGGRSGNRGMCAQPCRKPYTWVTSETDEYGRPVSLNEIPAADPYLLSPKDLCTYRNLPKLAGSGVVSLKIEGRMKSPEYVAIVVSTYRRALDAIAAGTFAPTGEAERDLLLAFNRGFTKGYLFGAKHAALMGRDAPDNRGIGIGMVTRYDENSRTAHIRPTDPVVPVTGDGILFSVAGHPDEDWGFAINTVPARTNDGYSLSVPRPVKKGAHLYLTSSRELEARARQIIQHPPDDLRRPVPIDLYVRVDAEGILNFEGVILTGCREPIIVTYQPDIRLEPARTRPLTGAQAEQQLTKTGGTPFVISSFSLVYNNDRFIPLAELNRARREFLERAEETLVAASVPLPESIGNARDQLKKRTAESFSRALKPLENLSPGLTLTVYADSLETVSAAAGAGCDAICFEPPQAGSSCIPGNAEDLPSLQETLELAAAICCAAKTRLILKFPRITGQEEQNEISGIVAESAAVGITECMAGNPGMAQAILEAAPGFTLSGSAGLNIFNHESVRALAGSYRMLTISPELSREQIRILTTSARNEGLDTVFGLIVLGNTDAMITKDCTIQPLLHCQGEKRQAAGHTFYGIRDETGRVFPVRIDHACRSHIGNAAELCLVDHLPSVMQAGITDMGIDCRGRTAAYTKEAVRICRDAVAATLAGAKIGDPRLIRAKEQVRTLVPGEITAGHFLRGLKES